jgi:hypothetical protein
MDINKSNTKMELLQEISVGAESFEDFSKDYKRQLIRDRKLDNDAKEHALKWKQDNMKKVYALCCICLFGLFTVIILDGFRIVGFILPIQVMIAIISGTLIYILGLYVIVLNNLFPKKRK